MKFFYFAFFWFFVGVMFTFTTLDEGLKKTRKQMIDQQVEIQKVKIENTHLRRELVEYHVRCD